MPTTDLKLIEAGVKTTKGIISLRRAKESFILLMRGVFAKTLGLGGLRPCRKDALDWDT